MTKRDLYSILEVKDGASKEEIESAFRELCRLYAIDSNETYSLFDEEEREKLLGEIKEAYETLIDEAKRKDYDRNVIQISKHRDFKPAEKMEEAIVAAGGDRVETAAKPKEPSKEIEPASRPSIADLLGFTSEEEVSGALLKKLRESMGLSLKELSSITKMSAVILADMESDDYLKLPARVYVFGFAKLYFKVFTDDFEKFARGYIRRYDEFFARRAKPA